MLIFKVELLFLNLIIRLFNLYFGGKLFLKYILILIIYVVKGRFRFMNYLYILIVDF